MILHRSLNDWSLMWVYPRPNVTVLSSNMFFQLDLTEKAESDLIGDDKLTLNDKITILKLTEGIRISRQLSFEEIKEIFSGITP